ncbi:MAG: hypothetical protein JWN62_2284 [Acidimicrobiales bacterium]|nr:hypothetical protein [Acidimicrobiales bacterium]
MLTREQLEAAFAALSDRLAERGVDATAVLFGDAAMMFAFDARTEIDHVDVAPTPRGQFLGAVRDVGQAQGLPAHWANDQATAKLPRDAGDDVISLWKQPHLDVVSVSADQLLVMRALSPTRPEDLTDIRLLAERLGFTALIDVEVLIAEIFPGRTINAKARDALDALF